MVVLEDGMDKALARARAFFSATDNAIKQGGLLASEERALLEIRCLLSTEAKRYLANDRLTAWRYLLRFVCLLREYTSWLESHVREARLEANEGRKARVGCQAVVKGEASSNC